MNGGREKKPCLLPLPLLLPLLLPVAAAAAEAAATQRLRALPCPGGASAAVWRPMANRKKPHRPPTPSPPFPPPAAAAPTTSTEPYAGCVGIHGASSATSTPVAQLKNRETNAAKNGKKTAIVFFPERLILFLEKCATLVSIRITLSSTNERS